MEFQRTFLAGRMNKDLDERLVPDGEYRDAVNVTIDTSEGSNIGAVQNTLGNTITTNITTILSKYQIAAPTNAITIGAISVEAENLLYWFVKADNFEGIFCVNCYVNCMYRAEPWSIHFSPKRWNVKRKQKRDMSDWWLNIQICQWNGGSIHMEQI